MRFSSWRISTKQNIDFSSESSSSTLREFFRTSSKELSKNSFLDVCWFPNGWSKSINQLFIHQRIFWKVLELLYLLFCKQSLVLILESIFINSIIFINIHFFSILLLVFNFNVKSFIIRFYKVNDINISPVNIFQSPLLWIYSDTCSLIYSNYFNSITRFYKIYKVFIAAKSDSLRSFTFRYRFRCFLKLNMLFITEKTLVMH